MTTRCLVLAAVLALLVGRALAQTAAAHGVIAQGATCLDLPGSFTASRPPPSGTRVIASRCSGRPSQRWTVLAGDDDSVIAVGGHRLSWVTSGPDAGRLVTSDGRVNRLQPLGWSPLIPPTWARGSATMRTYEGRCVALQGTEVRLVPCDDTDIRQHWQRR